MEQQNIILWLILCCWPGVVPVVAAFLIGRHVNVSFKIARRDRREVGEI